MAPSGDGQCCSSLRGIVEKWGKALLSRQSTQDWWTVSCLDSQLAMQYLKTRSMLAHAEGPVLGYARLVSRFSNFRHFGYLVPMFSSSLFFFFSSPFNNFWQAKQFGYHQENSFFVRPYGFLLGANALFISFCLFCAVLKIPWHLAFMFSGLCFTVEGRPASDWSAVLRMLAVFSKQTILELQMGAESFPKSGCYNWICFLFQTFPCKWLVGGNSLKGCRKDTFCTLFFASQNQMQYSRYSLTGCFDVDFIPEGNTRLSALKWFYSAFISPVI